MPFILLRLLYPINHNLARNRLNLNAHVNNTNLGHSLPSQTTTFIRWCLPANLRKKSSRCGAGARAFIRILCTRVFPKNLSFWMNLKSAGVIPVVASLYWLFDSRYYGSDDLNNFQHANIPTGDQTVIFFQLLRFVQLTWEKVGRVQTLPVNRRLKFETDLNWNQEF